MIKFEEFFEDSLRKKVRDFLHSGRPTAHIATALLITAVLGGVIAVGVVAPNLFSAFGKLQGKSRRVSKIGFYRLRQSFYDLRRRGYFEYIQNKDGVQIYRLNEKGKRRVMQLMFDNLFIPKPDKWDKKWHVVMFDVPHSRKKAREALRRKLKEMDFFQLQKSVWVHPFSCEAEIWYVADVFKVRPYLEILTIENFSNFKALAHFKYLLEEFA